MDALKITDTYDCGCQKQHGFALKTITPELLSAGLSKIMPTGLKALVLSKNGRLKKEMSKFYRTESPDELLNSCGIGLEGRDFGGILTAAQLSEDIRLVVSEGEYSALGKYIAKKAGVKHIIFGGGNLSAYDFVFDGRYTLDNLGLAEAVVTDSENINLPGGFAFVLSCFLALFDWDISSLLFSGKMCSHIFKEAQKTVGNLMDAVKIFSRRSSQLKKAVLHAQLSMAAHIQTAGAHLMLSGASQAAAALSMLYRHEQRHLMGFFDITFLLCPIVAKAYAAFLDKSIPFAFPPDNNLHALRLSEYLGLSQHCAYPIMPKYLNIKTIQLTDYRLGVYRDELLKHIYGIIRVFDAALPVYFKLFEDDGFSLKGYIDSLDSSLALGLGCDVLQGETLLSYIRAKGLLDRYIL